MPLVIDPEIRILPEEHNVFVLHPGDGKRFYNSFIQSSAVFLDYPGVKFNNAPSEDTQELRSKLRMGRTISLWYRRGKPEENKPSRNFEDYEVKNLQNESPRYVSLVRQIYSEAKPGDLIIIPGKGYHSHVFFGEFAGKFDPHFFAEVRQYPAEKIPARKVNWLKSNLTKGQFNRRLITLMQNRQAAIRVTKKSDLQEIYKFAYGDYIWGEQSGNLIRVTKEAIDLNDLNKAVDLTNYFASQYLALKKDRLEEFLALDFHEAIDLFYDKQYFGNVNVEIHSPGYFGRPMKDAALAGYVSAMLALSAAGVTAEEGKSAKVDNSANAEASFCDEKLETDIRHTMEAYANLHLWEDKVCPRRRETIEAVGLTSDVKVRR